MATDNDEVAGDSLRDALDAAFQQHATDEVDDTAAASAAVPAAKEEPTAKQAGQDRDEHGRFAPKQGDAEAKPEQVDAAAQAKPEQNAAAAPAAPDRKAPAAWSPVAREKWGAVDPEIRNEIHRREGEFQQMMQRTAGARQFVDAFENVVRPYEMFIRQESSNPLQAVQNLMQTAADLRIGAPQHKAALVADMITRYGVDIQILDNLLVGKGAGQAQQGQQFRDPRVDQLQAQLAQQQQAQERANVQAIHQQLNAFAQSHEFYGDVSGLMADLMDVFAKQGKTLELEAAYKQACQMHEGVSTILAQRSSAVKSPASNSQAVLRAKRAAASLKNEATPENGSVPRNDSIRASIEAAFDAHSGM